MQKADKKAAAAMRAREIYDRLMALPRDPSLSNNDWARKAGVNTSFFTNVRNGSEPTIGNLRSVLETVGVTLPEFFLAESRGRLVRTFDVAHLEQALREAMSALPRAQERRALYIAEVVAGVLALPEDAASDQPLDNDHYFEKSAVARAATK